jgi:iron-sulfur cluster repair protein YtfE (RIC family)
MDATTLLAEDHDIVRELFEDLEALTPRDAADRAALIGELKQELEVHARLEEEIFYPAVRRLSDDNAADLVEDALEQHDEVKLLVEELAQLDANDPELSERIAELQETVQAHVEEEENEIFPMAREKLGVARLEELGKRMESLKESLKGAVAVVAG